MGRIAPLTKLIFTLFVSVWAVFLTEPAGLAILTAGLVGILAASGVVRKTCRAMAGLLVFAVILGLIQYAFGMSVSQALSTGLKMLAMTYVFLLLLATTRMRDLTDALVHQCRVPYEYAFLFTAVLRFIPDFLAESRVVREAQACRGYRPHGHIVKRLFDYLAVVQPLVLKAVRRSETMAISLAMRGFGNRRLATAPIAIALAVPDYILLGAMVLVTAGLVAGV